MNNHYDSRQVGACGPDGRCLTCGKKGGTGGCTDCLSKSSAVTITVAPSVAVWQPGCPHARVHWAVCPWCLGINGAPT